MTYCKVPVQKTVTNFEGESVRTEYTYPGFGSINQICLELSLKRDEAIFRITDGDPTQIEGAIMLTKKAADTKLKSWKPSEPEPIGSEI